MCKSALSFLSVIFLAALMLPDRCNGAEIRITSARKVDSGTWVSPDSQWRLAGNFSVANGERLVAIRVIWKWEDFRRNQKWEEAVDFQPTRPGVWEANSKAFNGWSQGRAINGYRVYLVYKDAKGVVLLKQAR